MVDYRYYYAVVWYIPRKAKKPVRCWMDKMKVDDYKPTVSEFLEHKSQEEDFFAIARIDNVFAGRDRVSFITQKNLTDFGYTAKIWNAHNFYTIENAQDFIRSRLRTAIKNRNKMITAFSIIEITATITRVVGND